MSYHPYTYTEKQCWKLQDNKHEALYVTIKVRRICLQFWYYAWSFQNRILGNTLTRSWCEDTNVRRNFFFKVPKCWSGLNFVCPASMKHKRTSALCLPVCRRHAKYCTRLLFLFCPLIRDRVNIKSTNPTSTLSNTCNVTKINHVNESTHIRAVVT